MLLKVYTSQNSIKIIEDIKCPVVHLGKYVIDKNTAAEFLVDKGIHEEERFREGLKKLGPIPEYEIHNTFFFEGSIDTANIHVKIIDYLCKETGKYNRVLIGQYAYLCNDEGRTIEKIGV